MGAMDRYMMKQAATAMGVDPQKMIDVAFRKASLDKIEGQITSNSKISDDKDMVELVKNLATWDNGQAVVNIDGKDKAVSALTKDDKTKLSISFIVFTVLYVLLFNTILICELDMLLINMPFINGIFNSILDLILGINTFSVRLDILWEDPQWMMIFSIPLILMYNGKKGISLKYLFYIFYPCHIAILYILSII
jgi:hypothetical protein